ncbi:hypothetical protein LCGC14_2447230 [marine sediment metagenome]|uniref:Uncharacterized protein n=1 Tax=marine sediment metagenome TaxID=412755 RepID=A0A0F9BHC7_9ZZZZ
MFIRSTYTKYIVVAYRADGSEIFTVERYGLFGADECALSLANSMAGQIGASVTITAKVANGNAVAAILLEELSITE